MENKIKFDELIERLDYEFELSGFEFVSKQIRAGMEAAYYASIETIWHHENNCMMGQSGATFRVKAMGILSWGNDYTRWTGEGSVEWWTTSDHYVRIEVAQEEKYGDIFVSDVVIGDDDSEIFYGKVVEILGFEPERVSVPERPEH